MAEQNQNGDAPMMPEPTPVFDVTYQHIYAGQVFKQFYVFLWVSLALLIGAILPWNGEYSGKGITLWQCLMMVFSSGCIWNAYQCIKGRRLTLWPILAIEILGILFVLLHYRDVESQATIIKYNHLAAIQQEIDTAPESLRTKADFMDILTARQEAVKTAYDDGVGGTFAALFGFGSTYINSNVETRATAEAQLGAFGMGFHVTWLSLGFLMVFVIGSTIFAVVTAKPKEDPGEARRRARAGGAVGAPAKKDEEGGGAS